MSLGILLLRPTPINQSAVGRPKISRVTSVHARVSAWDEDGAAICNLPFIRKIEDEPVIVDCEIPPSPTPPATCDMLLFIPPPPGIDGLAGACPFFSVTATTVVGTSTSLPSATVDLCSIPPETSPGVLDLDNCNYQMCFTFDLPSAADPICPAIDITGLIQRVASEPAGGVASLDITRVIDPLDCTYDFNFDFKIPCSEIELTVGSTQYSAANAEPAVVITKTTAGCDYSFDFDFDLPCVVITATAAVTDGPSICELILTPVSTATECSYDFNFEFKIPCGDVNVTGSVTGDSRATLIVTKATNVSPSLFPPDVGDPCEYGFDFAFDIPCAVIELNATAEFVPTTDALSVTVNKIENNCIYDFDFEFRIPCAEIAVAATVTGHGACQLELVHTQTLTECAYDFNFDFDIPCADIRMTAVISSGAGAVDIHRLFSQTTVLSSTGIPMQNCIYDFSFDFEIGCPQIDISAKIVTTNTFQYSKQPIVTVNRKTRKPSPPTTFVDTPNARGEFAKYCITDDVPASDQCEYDFDLEFKIPKFCPRITTAETIAQPLTDEQLLNNGNAPQFMLDGVFDPKECSYVLQPFLFYQKELAKCTPIILTAKLEGTISCQTGCATAEVFGSEAATGISIPSVTVCPNSRDAYFRGDVLNIIYDCGRNTWVPLSSGTSEVFGLAQAKYDGSPGNVVGIFEIVGVDGEYISATLSADIYIKAGDKVKLSLEATCQWVVPDGRRTLHGTWDAATPANTNGDLDGVAITASGLPYGSPEDGATATAVMVAGHGWIVIASKCD